MQALASIPWHVFLCLFCDFSQEVFRKFSFCSPHIKKLSMLNGKIVFRCWANHSVVKAEYTHMVLGEVAAFSVEDLRSLCLRELFLARLCVYSWCISGCNILLDCSARYKLAVCVCVGRIYMHIKAPPLKWIKVVRTWTRRIWGVLSPLIVLETVVLIFWHPNFIIWTSASTVQVYIKVKKEIGKDFLVCDAFIRRRTVWNDRDLFISFVSFGDPEQLTWFFSSHFILTNKPVH